jgi:hypothetical protein
MSASFPLFGIADAAVLAAEAFIEWTLEMGSSNQSLTRPINPFSVGSTNYRAWREGWNRCAKAANMPKEMRI